MAMTISCAEYAKTVRKHKPMYLKNVKWKQRNSGNYQRDDFHREYNGTKKYSKTNRKKNGNTGKIMKTKHKLKKNEPPCEQGMCTMKWNEMKRVVPVLVIAQFYICFYFSFI